MHDRQIFNLIWTCSSVTAKKSILYFRCTATEMSHNSVRHCTYWCIVFISSTIRVVISYIVKKTRERERERETRKDRVRVSNWTQTDWVWVGLTQRLVRISVNDSCVTLPWVSTCSYAACRSLPVMRNYRMEFCVNFGLYSVHIWHRTKYAQICWLGTTTDCVARRGARVTLRLKWTRDRIALFLLVVVNNK